MIFYLIFGILGLLFGSFISVCISRIPKKESIVFGSSHCVNCGYKLKAYDLIPVLSYIMLGGRCRNCRKPISVRYPLLELLSCGLFLLNYHFLGLGLKTVLYCALSAALLIIAFIDLDTKEIPNGLVLSIIVIGILALFLKDMPARHRVLGFFASSILLLAVYILSRGGLGEGDIKLMAASGLVIGFKAILLALFIGCIIGGIAGMYLLITKRGKRDSAIAFAPYLCIGIYIASLFSDTILAWYISIFMS